MLLLMYVIVYINLSLGIIMYKNNVFFVIVEIYRIKFYFNKLLNLHYIQIITNNYNHTNKQIK